MHPKEILEVARQSGMIPPHLNGKTQYKTLAARLSTEIRQNAVKSPFFRTSANRFFLRDLKTQIHDEYKAPRREKTLHNEYVLTIQNDPLAEWGVEGIIPNIEEIIEEAARKNWIRYIVRRSAEKRFDVKQIVSYALIYRAGSILTYRRGTFTTAADELQGKRSIGFGGHVSDEDRNLFDISGHGIFENVRRELSEELVFDRNEAEYLRRQESFQLLCGINSYETTEAKKHIAVTVVYFCSDAFSPEKNELSINDLRWTDISRPENDLDSFEPWSKSILQALYTGELKIERPEHQ